jgi:hypothetical protein
MSRGRIRHGLIVMIAGLALLMRSATASPTYPLPDAGFAAGYTKYLDTGVFNVPSGASYYVTPISNTLSAAGEGLWVQSELRNISALDRTFQLTTARLNSPASPSVDVLLHANESVLITHWSDEPAGFETGSNAYFLVYGTPGIFTLHSTVFEYPSGGPAAGGLFPTLTFSGSGSTVTSSSSGLTLFAGLTDAPEPGSGVLLIGAGMLALRRRR